MFGNEASKIDWNIECAGGLCLKQKSLSNSSSFARYTYVASCYHFREIFVLLIVRTHIMLIWTILFGKYNLPFNTYNVHPDIFVSNLMKNYFWRHC